MIAKSLKEILLADTATTDRVETRVFVGRRPQGTKLPAVLLRRRRSQPLDVLDGLPPDDETTVQVDILADDETGGYPLVTEIGDRVRTVLEGYAGTAGDHYINGVSVVSDIDTPSLIGEASDNWLHRRSIDLRITATNSVARA